MGKTWVRGTERNFPLELSLSLDQLPPPGPSGSVSGCGGDFYTEPPCGVGVLIMGIDHPAGTADSRLPTYPLSCVGSQGQIWLISRPLLPAEQW